MNEPHEDDRPWERPGAMRRDCEPHRGGFLYILALVSLFGTVLVLPIPATLCLSLYVKGVAQQDLLKMRLGEMDSSGKVATGIAANLAGVVLVLALLPVVGCGGFITLAVLSALGSGR